MDPGLWYIRFVSICIVRLIMSIEMCGSKLSAHYNTLAVCTEKNQVHTYFNPDSDL